MLAAFTIPYGALQLLVGPLGDGIGKPRVLVCALIGYALATFGCAFAANLADLTLLRACAGACSAGLIPVCLAYIADGTSYEERQVTLGRFLMGVVLAQMLAGPIGGAFGQFITWRGVFLMLSAAALLLAVLIGLCMKDLPQRPAGQSVGAGDLCRPAAARPDPAAAGDPWWTGSRSPAPFRSSRLICTRSTPCPTRPPGWCSPASESAPSPTSPMRAGCCAGSASTGWC